MKNYATLATNIRNQLNPDNILLEKSFTDELGTISYSDVLTFIRLAMRGVEESYTQKSKDAGQNVKQHLDKGLVNKTFKYQGSIMTNTHIKGHSDIDLLVISEKFYTFDSKRINEILLNESLKMNFNNDSLQKLEKEQQKSTYSGNTIEDLKKLRMNSENILSSIYRICDISKPKAIKLKNQNFDREVDVVIANWYDDVKSIINDKGEYRGIQIFDNNSNTKCFADYPFLSIERINNRSSITNGRLKKMIRFLKNIKANSDIEIKLSSFDINAICYDIDIQKYKSVKFNDLVSILYNQLVSICSNKTKSDKLLSVDEREYIFKHHSEKLTEVWTLAQELKSILEDLKKVPIYG